MAWYTCTINQVGTLNYGSTTNPNVILNFTNADPNSPAPFANYWFICPEGVQVAMLALGIAALTNNKRLVVGAEDVSPMNEPYSAISNLYLQG